MDDVAKKRHEAEIACWTLLAIHTTPYLALGDFLQILRADGDWNETELAALQAEMVRRLAALDLGDK